MSYVHFSKSSFASLAIACACLTVVSISSWTSCIVYNRSGAIGAMIGEEVEEGTVGAEELSDIMCE